MTREPLAASSMFASLTVNDVEKSLRFYTEGLGFEVASRHEENGKVTFCELKAGGARLGLGLDDGAKGRDRVKGAGLRFWIETKQDLRAIADRAKAAGIALDSEPAPLPWGPMAFSLTDPDGFRISVSQGRSS